MWSENSVAVVDRSLDALERELSAIRADMLAAERHLSGRWRSVPQARRQSARNLLHYLAMRRRDLRGLQPKQFVWYLATG